MKKVLAFLIIISFTFSVFAAGDVVKEEEHKDHKENHVCYKSVVMQINAFAKQEKYDDAIKLLQDAKVNPNYTGHYEHIYKNLAFFNDKAKKYEENIKVWNEGLDKNVTFDIDPKGDDYKPYLKLKGFDDVVKKNAEYIEKGVKAKAECDDHEEEINTQEK